MSMNITIRDDIYKTLKEMKEKNNGSFSDAIMDLLQPLQEATINQEGRISKTLAGKTILFKIKE